ncbi:MAG: Sodium-dependent dicarboxylate transporter SdcS [Candidatus Ordinivivax streblomastigis]|uniref:Sodium-dependent dicarboxylate transporter SdcS n=1 Tax=Candidatus Ordinivivax streblomastigis TaxID=2540710 RepID=A0A5M8NVU6_9BACT|nr:MAG: Sodium-dependent dicarboxylate transporter SdcS [Candidatus Ordinivivax streblomastigis]
METNMILTIAILAVSAAFFMSGKIRSDLVALCALILLLLFGILTPEEGLSGFSNSVVIMMMGLFVVGGAIFQTGLAKMISSKILKLAGNSESKLLILIMLVTAFIGAFVSNTGTVALMLPIVVSMAAGTSIKISRLLMPLAFASSMGGMMTLIGTPPNLVIQNTLTEAGYKTLTFFSFTPVGIICIAVGVIGLIPLSRLFLSKEENKKKKQVKNKSMKELAGEYQLSRNLCRVQVNRFSTLTRKTIQELETPQKYDINIIEVRRKAASSSLHFFKTTTTNQQIAQAETLIQEGDILYVLGEFANIQTFVDDCKLNLLDAHKSEEKSDSSDTSLEFKEIGIAEILLMPTSKLINQPIKDSGFREKFSVNILGIQRKRKYILQNLKDEKIQVSDLLLVQGTWANIARLNEDQSEWVVLGQPLAKAAKIALTHKAPIAALIMLGMIVTMMFDFIPVAPVTAVVIAALLMVLTGCLHNVEEAYKTINWESIVLIAAMLPMSLALEKTGASTIVSQVLVNGLGSYGPHMLLAGIYFTTSLMTMFISNTATAVLLAPIALHSAIQLEYSPYPFLFAVTVGASMCFASPFSTPPNALVMSAGRYTFTDYVKVGLPLQILMGVVMIFVLPLLFPF